MEPSSSGASADAASKAADKELEWLRSAKAGSKTKARLKSYDALVDAARVVDVGVLEARDLAHGAAAAADLPEGRLCAVQRGARGDTVGPSLPKLYLVCACPVVRVIEPLL